MDASMEEVVVIARELVAAAEKLLECAATADSRPDAGQLTGLRRMAVEAKLPDKPYYTIAEIAEATGIPRTTLDVERRAGRLKSFLPDGQQRGTLVKCEWFDAWMRDGCR